MPITKSAKKALKVSVRRHGENLLMKQEIKNRVKGLRLAISTSKSDLTSELSYAFSALDKAAKKKFIHKNKASRLKSRLSLAASKVGSKTESKIKETKTAAKFVPKKSPTSKTKSKK